MKNSSMFFKTTLITLFLSACTGSDGLLTPEDQDPDPVIVDFPIAYVKRSIPVEMDNNGVEMAVTYDLREPYNFNPGAALYFRPRATVGTIETNLTDALFDVEGEEPAEGEVIDEEMGPQYDVKDLAVNTDGSKLAFAMRAPEIEGADEEDQPTWNIWELDPQTLELRRIIASDITAEAGQDVMPAYLPDGRLVFASTRQRQAKAVLLDEGKPQFSALDENRNEASLALHVMQDDGSEIKQISFNQSHDMQPSVLPNGKIVFSRWDRAPGNNTINLYQINPDGSQLEILYGRHSHDTGTDASNVEFASPKPAEDGRLTVSLRPTTSQHLGGELAFIDWQNFIDESQPTASSGAIGSAQESATPFMVRSDDQVSLGGRFADVFPLLDGTSRLLISWTPCRLDAINDIDEPIFVQCDEITASDETAREAAPLYGIWIYDPTDGSQLPVVLGEEGIVAHEIVAMAPRERAAVIPDLAPLADAALINENVGLVHIRSVYDLDGVDTSLLGITALADPAQSTAADRPVRFLRLVKPVSMPDDDLVDLDGTAFGRSRAQGMRDILGYVQVHPDGSALFKVPADVAFGISLLDEDGRRVGERHQNWMSIAAGEVKQCNGCHERDSELPHGRMDAQADSINLGAPATGLPFANTNPELFADEGETMAEVYSRINGAADLSVDITFDDVWTDPNIRALDPSITLEYNSLLTPPPTPLGCMTNWNGRCRITINYIDSIQPLWELPRQIFDDMGNLLADNTCITCHGQQDAMAQVQVPAGQLELGSAVSADEPDHLVSYRELMFNDNVVELANGAIIDLLVPLLDANGNPVYEVDADGNLILDPNGDPIPVMVTVNIASPLNLTSAAANDRFFSLFDVGASHQGWLSDAELKLISEWLDLGGQYYNNPFDVPQ